MFFCNFSFCKQYSCLKNDLYCSFLVIQIMIDKVFLIQDKHPKIEKNNFKESHIDIHSTFSVPRNKKNPIVNFCDVLHIHQIQV